MIRNISRSNWSTVGNAVEFLRGHCNTLLSTAKKLIRTQNVFSFNSRKFTGILAAIVLAAGSAFFQSGLIRAAELMRWDEGHGNWEVDGKTDPYQTGMGVYLYNTISAHVSDVHAYWNITGGRTRSGTLTFQGERSNWAEASSGYLFNLGNVDRYGSDSDFARMYLSKRSAGNNACGTRQKCRLIRLVPNSHKLNRELLPGETLRITLRADRHSGQSDLYLNATIRHDIAIRPTWDPLIVRDTEGRLDLRIDQRAAFVDQVATLRISKPAGTSVVFEEVVENYNDGIDLEGDAGAITNDVDPPSGFNPSNTRVYGSGLHDETKKLKYGFWILDETTNNEKLAFRPNNSEIANLEYGDVVTSVLELDINDNTKTLKENVFTVLISKEGVRLMWPDEDTGKIQDTGENSYPMIEGTSRLTLPKSNEFLPVVSARDSSLAEEDSNINSIPSQIKGFSWEVTTRYGKWLWRSDDSGFRFEPDPNGINRLENEDTETSTLHVQYQTDSGQKLNDATVTVTITGFSDPPPTVSISSDFGNEDGTQGAGVTAGHIYEYSLERTGSNHEELDIFIDIRKLDSGKQPIQGLDPESVQVTIPAGESSTIFSQDSDTLSVINNLEIGFYQLEVDVDDPEIYTVDSYSIVTVRVKQNGTSTLSAANPRMSITAGSSAPYRVGSMAVFTVTASDGTRNIAPLSDTPVHYKISNSDYLSEDFELRSSILLAGSDSADILIPITDPNENRNNVDGAVTVTLLDGQGYVLSDSPHHQASVGATDDNAILSIAESSLVEGDTGDIVEASFTVSLSTVLVGDVSFTLSVTDDSATGGSDFPADYERRAASTEQINGGESSKTFTVRIFPDDVVEPSESFRVSLFSLQQSNPDDGKVTLGVSTALVTIIDDDDPTSVIGPELEITLSAVNTNVDAGEQIEFILESNLPAPKNLDVGLRITQTGNVLVWAFDKVELLRNTTTVGFKLGTMNNPSAGQVGVVTVAVADGYGYRSDSTEQVIVTRQITNETTQYSVVSSVITTILQGIPETPLGESDVVKPTLSINTVKGIVEEGESAIFAISSTHAVDSDIPIRIKLNQSGDFINGPMDRSVNLKTNWSEAKLVVDTDDDQLAESDGRITATIQEGSGYLVGSENTAHVTVSDALDVRNRKNRVVGALHAALPDLLAHSTNRTLGLAEERIIQAFNGSPATSVKFNGQSPAMAVLQTGGEMLNGNHSNWRSIIDNSSLSVALYPEGGETSPATVWGVGDRWNLTSDGTGAQKSRDGESVTGHLGFDAQVGRGILAGLAMSVSQSEIGSGQTGDSELAFGMNSTGVHPYLGLSSPDGNFQMRILAGYGENQLELRQEEYSHENLSGRFHTFGFGGSNRLYSNGNFGGLHNLELNIAGEAWHSQQSVDSVERVVDNLQVNAHHLRIAVEEVHHHYLEIGGTLSPSISIGLRGDGKNDRSVFGLDVGSGFRYGTFDGLEILGSGKSLLAGLSQVYNWEIENSFGFDSENDGKGLLFNLKSSWSGTQANADRYWESELVDGSDDSIGILEGDGFEFEIGYGFEILHGSAVMTPYYAYNQTHTDENEFQVGSRLKTDTGVDLQLEAVRSKSENGTVGQEYNVTGRINW